MRRIPVVLATLLGSFIVMPITFDPVTHSQVTCLNLGSIIDCQGPNNYSSTQVPLSRNQGVIITDQTTTPYTILTPTPSLRDTAPISLAPSNPGLMTLPPAYELAPLGSNHPTGTYDKL